MMEIALLLLACAVFAALAAVAVTAALKAARVEDVIAEVFSPWIQDPFGPSDAPETAEPAPRDQGEAQAPPAPDVRRDPGDQRAVAARV